MKRAFRGESPKGRGREARGRTAQKGGLRTAGEEKQDEYREVGVGSAKGRRWSFDRAVL